MNKKYLCGMKWQLIIFDLDGTLINTIEDLGIAVNHALADHSFPQHEISEYKGMVGHGVRNLVWRSMPEALKDDEHLLDVLLADFMDYYYRHIDEHSRPYDGMPELLSELQADGVRLAVASNKFQSGTDALMRRFFPDIHFASVLGGRKGVPLKPDPAVVGTILEAAGVSQAETVMVGDSATDIATAAAGKVESIAVTWGFRPKEAIQGAGSVVDTVQQLRGKLLGE